MFPQTTVVEPNVPGTSPFNYSDLVELRAQILRSITASMQKEMSTFHSSLSSEMENHVEKHIEKVCMNRWLAYMYVHYVYITYIHVHVLVTSLRSTNTMHVPVFTNIHVRVLIYVHCGPCFRTFLLLSAYCYL